jgi:hypothetical protein
MEIGAILWLVVFHFSTICPAEDTPQSWIRIHYPRYLPAATKVAVLVVNRIAIARDSVCTGHRIIRWYSLLTLCRILSILQRTNGRICHVNPYRQPCRSPR